LAERVLNRTAVFAFHASVDRGDDVVAAQQHRDLAD